MNILSALQPNFPKVAPMIRPTIPLVLAASLFSLPAAAAESPFQLGLALRTGYSLTTSDNIHPFLMGAGISGDYALNKTLSLRGELAYFYRKGQSYRAELLPAAAGQPQADPENSGDMRKNKLEGLVLRLSGLYALDSACSLQGGLQIGNSRFTHEYIGQTADTDWTYTDTYNGVPVKSAFSVSPFVGVQFDVDRDSAVEVNLIGLSYTAINFQHTPGSTLLTPNPDRPGTHLVYQGDRLDEKKRMSMGVELSYRFRF